jgi:hypothetical protein
VAAEIPVFRPIALAIVLGCAVVTMADSDAAPAGLPEGCSQINSQLVSCTYSTPSASPVKFTVPAGVSDVTITARGGTGGSGGDGGLGGRAGIVTANVDVGPGIVLDLYVAARGMPGRAEGAGARPVRAVRAVGPPVGAPGPGAAGRAAAEVAARSSCSGASPRPPTTRFR